ncbi:MAG TPA: response regulator [Usitatibacter sp.]|jgi:DNA-binding NarL/FixJ family response regulator|nr:response regulator [Usitatibacter sp.]
MGTAQPAASTRVYIVDDSAPIRARLAEMLGAMEGVRIVGEAASAAGAVAGILRLRPDSVLLDLDLTGRTGIDVMRSVHPAAPEIVFVVLTNHAEPQYRRAAHAAGAAYFLDKSRELDRVREVIAEIAATRHQEMRLQ